MSDVPAVLKSALAQLRREQPAAHAAPSRIVVGDLRIVGPLPHRPTDSRIVLVLEVDEPNDFADVLLVHPATELATDRDAVVPMRTSSAAYDVVVQTDLRAVVWTFQIERRVGRLDEVSLGEIRAWIGGNNDDESLLTRPSEEAGIHYGTRLAGPLDRRWAFKEAEGIALRGLAGDCTEALLDQDLVWRIDPGLLRPELLDLVDDREALLAELLHWVATRSLSLTDEDLELLLSAGALDIEEWAHLSDIGADVLMSIQNMVVQAATGVTASTHHELRYLITASHLGPPGSVESMELIHYLGAKESVSS